MRLFGGQKQIEDNQQNFCFQIMKQAQKLLYNHIQNTHNTPQTNHINYFKETHKTMSFEKHLNYNAEKRKET